MGMMFEINNTRPVMQRQLDATRVQRQVLENCLTVAEAAQPQYDQFWLKRARTIQFGAFAAELTQASPGT
jgi:hypothetical protein